LFWALKRVRNSSFFYFVSIGYTFHDSTFTHLEKHVGNISGLNTNPNS